MSSFVLNFFLFVCLFIHACNARSYVGVVVHKEGYHLVELGEKSFSHDNGEKTIGNMVKGNYLKPLSKEAYIEDVSERSSDQMDDKILGQGLKPEATKVKGLRVTKPTPGWKRRLMLTISMPQDNEEMVNSKGEEEVGADEDIVSMDYALPHRKPPIHNEEN